MPEPRVVGFDVARALAILGMVIVHFALTLALTDRQPAGVAAALDLLDGRPAAIFILLAGIGISLRSRRALAGLDSVAVRKLRWSISKRGLCLLGCGFANLLIWQGDILRVYGVSLLLAAPVLTLSSRGLWGLSGLFGALFLVLFAVMDYDRHWDWPSLQYHDLWTASGVFENLFYNGFRSVFPWTGLFFAGMALGRLEFRHPQVAQRLIVTGLSVSLVSLGISLALTSSVPRHFREMDQETVQALFGTESMPPLPLFWGASCGLAVAVIAVCVRWGERSPQTLLVRVLAATGQLALTWYVAHIVLGLGTVWALGLAGTQTLPVAIAAGAAFFVLAATLSVIWKSVFAHGPLEGLLRLATG